MKFPITSEEIEEATKRFLEKGVIQLISHKWKFCSGISVFLTVMPLWSEATNRAGDGTSAAMW